MKNANKSLMFFDVGILDMVPFFNASDDSVIGNNSVGVAYNSDTSHVITMLIYFSHFKFYFVPVTGTLGIVGNSLAALILMTTTLRIQPTLHFAIAKCAADSLFLISLLLQWLRTIGYDLYESGVWCHILAMVTHASNFLSTWFVVCLIVDRFIIVYVAGSDKPMCGLLKHCPCGLFTARIKFKPGGQMSIPGWTVLKTVITIISLSLLSVAVYLNISLTMGVTVRSENRICVPLPVYSSVMQLLGEIDIFLNVLLPYMISITLTIATCRRVLRFHAARKRTITKREFSRHHYQFYSKSQLHLTVLSAGVCGCYILLTGPSQILRFQYTLREMLNFTPRLTIHEYFWQHVFLILYFLSFSINFLVLFIFHKGFRKTIELTFVKISYKMRMWHNHRDNASTAQSPMTFAVDFSSTLLRPERNIAWAERS